MFEFVNRGTVLTVSSENGAVLSVTAGGKAATAEADRAFRLRLLDGAGDAVTLDDRDFRDFSSDGGELLRWRGCRKFPGLEMRLRIRPAEDGSFRFRPAVAGIPGGYRLEWVSAPLVENAEREVPEILGSAWRAPDGQEAVFLANYLTRKNSCRLNGKTVEVPPLDVVMIAGTVR